MDFIQLPDSLVNEVRNGGSVLFLGAGASMEAGAPSGGKLAEMIAMQFLNEKYKSRNLD
jgi:hypothetical protein